MFMRTCCAVAMLTACATLAVAQTRNFAPVTEEVLANPDPGDWLMLNRTFDQQRYSPLDQVNATNGDLIWEYARDYPQAVNPRAARNKNLGIYEDMIYFAAPDGFLLALDAATGKLRWETKVDEGGQTAGGILVADGKVITNRTCIADVRSKCFIAAHDARTGKEVWRFYTTAARSQRRSTSTAIPRSPSTSRPAGSPGTTRSFPATTGTRTTIRNASSRRRASIPIPGT